MLGRDDACARPRAVLWSGRGSPLGPGCSLGCPGCMYSWVWRWRWCADVYGPGVVLALPCALWSDVPVSAVTCLGTAMHEHGRAQSCGRGAEARWVRATPWVAPVAPARVHGVGAGVQMCLALGLSALPCASWSGVPVSAARCLGTAMHEHGRAHYCGLGRRSPLGPGCSLSCPGGTCSWVWRWRWCANMYGPEIVPALLCAFWSGVPVSAERCLGAAMHKHGRAQSCGRGAEAC